MRQLERAVVELVGVLLAGMVSFFLDDRLCASFLFLWVCGIASGLLSIAALFSAAMWLLTHDPHAFRSMLGFLFAMTRPAGLAAGRAAARAAGTRLGESRHRRAPRCSYVTNSAMPATRTWASHGADTPPTTNPRSAPAATAPPTQPHQPRPPTVAWVERCNEKLVAYARGLANTLS
jgi:hypothetical protein